MRTRTRTDRICEQDSHREREGRNFPEQLGWSPAETQSTPGGLKCVLLVYLIDSAGASSVRDSPGLLWPGAVGAYYNALRTHDNTQQHVQRVGARRRVCEVSHALQGQGEPEKQIFGVRYEDVRGVF